MKPFILIGSLICSLVFFPFCSSIEKQPGTISRNASLIEDLETKLSDPLDKARFKQFISNIREEEKLSDRTIVESRTNALEAHRKALESSEDAGKWFGIRNLFYMLAFAFVCFVGFTVGKEFLKKRLNPVA